VGRSEGEEVRGRLGRDKDFKKQEFLRIS